MPNLPWFEDYSGQTVEQLLLLEGQFRTDSLLVAFEQALGRKEVREGPENLTDEERVILSIEELEREVNNGGYGQFFLNSSIGYAPTIVDSLRRIGCPATAAITLKALEALRIASPSIETIEAVMMEANPQRDEELRQCDDLFFSATENIGSSLFAFIKTNKSSISL
jgi:hypothetical protein